MHDEILIEPKGHHESGDHNHCEINDRQLGKCDPASNKHGARHQRNTHSNTGTMLDLFWERGATPIRSAGGTASFDGGNTNTYFAHTQTTQHQRDTNKFNNIVNNDTLHRGTLIVYPYVMLIATHGCATYVHLRLHAVLAADLYHRVCLIPGGDAANTHGGARIEHSTCLHQGPHDIVGRLATFDASNTSTNPPGTPQPQTSMASITAAHVNSMSYGMPGNNPHTHSNLSTFNVFFWDRRHPLKFGHKGVIHLTSQRQHTNALVHPAGAD